MLSCAVIDNTKVTPRTVFKRVGQMLTIQCDSVPTQFRVNWIFNDGPILEYAAVSQTSWSSVVHVNNVHLNNTGYYTCIGQNIYTGKNFLATTRVQVFGMK